MTDARTALRKYVGPRGMEVYAAPIAGLDVSDDVVTAVRVSAPNGDRVTLEPTAEFWCAAQGLPAKGDYAWRQADHMPVHWSPRATFEADFRLAETA